MRKKSQKPTIFRLPSRQQAKVLEIIPIETKGELMVSLLAREVKLEQVCLKRPHLTKLRTLLSQRTTLEAHLLQNRLLLVGITQIQSLVEVKLEMSRVKSRTSRFNLNCLDLL